MSDNENVEGFTATAFRPFTFQSTNTNRQFSMTVGYRLFGAESLVTSGSGDGMAFVLHQDPRGLDTISTGGGALGIYTNLEDSTDTAVGIQRALVIELDTVKQEEYLDDGISNIHVIQVSCAKGVAIV